MESYLVCILPRMLLKVKKFLSKNNKYTEWNGREEAERSEKAETRTALGLSASLYDIEKGEGK